MNKKEILKLAKGFRGRAKNCIRIARERVEKALQYSYRDRRNKKRDMRSLWIQRINAGTRQHGVNYGNFMHGLMKENIQLNRKVLSEISMHEPYSFKALVDISRNAFPGNKNVVLPTRKLDLFKNLFAISLILSFSLPKHTPAKQSDHHDEHEHPTTIENHSINHQNKCFPRFQYRYIIARNNPRASLCLVVEVMAAVAAAAADSCCSLTLFLLLSSFLLFSSKPTFAESDSQALLKLKESFDDGATGALVSWNPGSDPCNEEGTWEGLLCSNGILQGLRLEGMGLSGKIDVDALILLNDLRYFSVMNNSFHGNIPEINRLSALRALYLSKNKFSGEIPPDYFTGMGSLKKVWLSDNEFSGKIPRSLSNVSRLLDLHLENNQFTGKIPDFNQRDLRSVNFSNNKLEGQIPSSLLRFEANVFAENAGLCGAQIMVDCNKTDQTSHVNGGGDQNTDKPSNVNHGGDRNTDKPNNVNGGGDRNTDKPSNVNGGGDQNDNRKIIAATVTLGVMLIALIVFLITWRKKKRKKALNSGGNATENGNSIANIEAQISLPATVGEVHVVRRTGNSNRTVRSSSHPGTTRGGTVPELVMVNHEMGVFGLPSLMKATAEVLGNGALGSSYKATMANKVSVVVKRTKEMNSLGKDEFDAGVKRLGMLKHPNVLTPLAYHYRIDEKLFVYEFIANGSLLYRLHGDQGTSAAALDWLARLKIVQGIIEGLGYIHAELAYLDVPHGNLKSSNVLLGPENRTLVSEYGLCSLVSSDRTKTLIAYNTPEAIQHGKVCHKSDVYCLGIIILEILTGKFPSQYIENGKGGIDVVELVAMAISEGKQAELFDSEIASSSNSLREMEKLLHIGSLCTKTSLDERLDLKEAIKRIQEIRVDNAPESDPHPRKIEASPSLQDGLGDAKSYDNSSSIREGDV
ncbi:hypothetical protein HRI_000905900 [Hibiscus trionum]|uniref:Large ribosomal subunit protein bL20c n=2 Tax=Malvoideae TaxID=214907 RepID=A0A9W7LQJ6_HIBTR|nr:hypothetical protein HRI_000905900 [Hibiscus trionum]